MARPPTSDDAEHRALVAELRRRIAVISSYPEEAFGVIRNGELGWMAVAFVVLPLVVVWFFR